MAENTFKTIGQIKEATPETQRLYYRPVDFARAVALTLFLQELEEKHGDDFKLLTCHPHWLHIRSESQKQHDENKDIPVFTLGLWAHFKIGDTCYYIQHNDNPFFDAYFGRYWTFKSQKYIVSDDMKRSEYLTGMNEVLYASWNWGCDETSISTLVSNHYTAFDRVNTRHIGGPNTYTQKIPSYSRPEKQTIYTH